MHTRNVAHKFLHSQVSWKSWSRFASSKFVAPSRPTLRLSDEEGGKNIEGRENPKLFSEEYIPPQILPEWHSNKLKYRLERMDCLRRRNVIEIPEFYPGSILSVTVSDEYGPEKNTRFVGRCLWRDGFGLACKFVLRNVIEGEGFEIMYHLHSPTIQEIQVLRLEKWIDTDLRYLRDADAKHCTIDPNMIAQAPTPVSQPLPVFKEKVNLGDRTWWGWKFDRSWPRPYNAFIEEHLLEEDYIERDRLRERQTYLKYDICRHYDTRSLKKQIMSEMETNQQRIKNITKSTSWQPN